MSLVVVPNDKPKIWVCVAPDTPTVHKSLLIEVTAGAIADGGGDLTVVVLFEVESVVLLDVESVTMVSAIVLCEYITKSTNISNLRILDFLFDVVGLPHKTIYISSKGSVK
jgi:hypothetical protein